MSKKLYLLPAFITICLSLSQSARAGTIEVIFSTEGIFSNSTNTITIKNGNNGFTLSFSGIESSLTVAPELPPNLVSFGTMTATQIGTGGEYVHDLPFSLQITQIEPVPDGDPLTYTSEIEGKIRGQGGNMLTITFDDPLVRFVTGEGTVVTYELFRSYTIDPTSGAGDSQSRVIDGNITAVSVPEPSFILLLGLGLGATVFASKKLKV